jgi:hypothetical protein
VVLTLEELDRAIDAKTRRSRCLDTGKERLLWSATGALIATNGRDLESMTACIVWRANSDL